MSQTPIALRASARLTEPSTLRVTPAMAAGVTGRLWSIKGLAAMVEEAAPKTGSAALPEEKRGVR